MVSILMEAGLDIDQMDVRGNNPAHYAINQDFEEVVKLFPGKAEDEQSYFCVDDVGEVFSYDSSETRLRRCTLLVVVKESIGFFL